jgi:hypothetical protein
VGNETPSKGPAEFQTPGWIIGLGRVGQTAEKRKILGRRSSWIRMMMPSKTLPSIGP